MFGQRSGGPHLLLAGQGTVRSRAAHVLLLPAYEDRGPDHHWANCGEFRAMMRSRRGFKTEWASTNVSGQNANVLRLIARRWFRHLPRVRRPSVVKLAIRLHRWLSKRRRKAPVTQ